MAAPTAVNSQITDSITQVDTEVVGVAPGTATGNLFQSTSQALGLAALNATSAQQNNNINAQASSTTGVTTLYSIETSTDAVGTSDIFSMRPGKKHRGKKHHGKKGSLLVNSLKKSNVFADVQQGGKVYPSGPVFPQGPVQG